jgi:hypothetical protein
MIRKGDAVRMRRFVECGDLSPLWFYEQRRPILPAVEIHPTPAKLFLEFFAFFCGHLVVAKPQR